MGFKEARVKAGLTVRRVSIALDVSQTAVFSWENGTHSPETRRLPQIAKLYGCTVDELLGTNGNYVTEGGNEH